MKEREERLLRVPPNDVLIIAEKPSVARDLAKEVKATSCGNGYFHGNGYVVWWSSESLLLCLHGKGLDDAGVSCHLPSADAMTT